VVIATVRVGEPLSESGTAESCVAALRLGTQDALKFFHRGYIERCLGHDAVAKTWFRGALALNPHFSLLWSPTAKRWAE